MTQLIVALDLPDARMARGKFNSLVREAGVVWFKVGPGLLLTAGAVELLDTIANRTNLFLDLKLYDTRDTVELVASRAFDIGARFLTVHATPSMLEAAMRAKPAGDRCKVLAVSRLTDDESVPLSAPPQNQADGLVCDVQMATVLRSDDARYFDRHKGRTGEYPGIIVCPGIRPLTTSSAITGSHVNPATPAEAKAARADYIVVGRPIIDAHDPVAAARAILEEIA